MKRNETSTFGTGTDTNLLVNTTGIPWQFVIGQQHRADTLMQMSMQTRTELHNDTTWPPVHLKLPPQQWSIFLAQSHAEIKRIRNGRTELDSQQFNAMAER